MKTAPASKFTIHPALASVPTLPDLIAGIEGKRRVAREHCERLEALRENWGGILASIKGAGVIEPVKVIEGTLEVVDGRHRILAAQAAKVAVPYVEVPEVTAEAIIVESVAGRRHWTKSMLAYLAATNHPTPPEGRPAKNSAKSAEFLSAADLGARYGVSARMVEAARELVGKFSKSKRLREKWEPQIWLGLSLGGIKAGMEGDRSTGGRERRPSSFDSAQRAVRSLGSRLGAFGDWTEEHRDLFVAEFGEMARELPPEAVTAIRAAIDATWE